MTATQRDGGKDQRPLRLLAKPEGHREVDHSTVRCGDLPGTGQQDQREDSAGGYRVVDLPLEPMVLCALHSDLPPYCIYLLMIFI